MFISADIQSKTKLKLTVLHGKDGELRIERGVIQAAELWREQDGTAEEFMAFCEEHFIADEKQLDDTFDHLDKILEGIDGHFNAMSQDILFPMHVDIGPLTSLDRLWGEYDPSAHLTDDLFANKIIFIILLNFPRYSLAEKKALSEAWSDRDWAMVRLGDRFRSRVPADIQKELSQVDAAATEYVSDYNIIMGNLRDRKEKKLFPDDLNLITHWGIRDELKSQYGAEEGLARQEIIFSVMNSIILQTIPAVVINNPGVTWHVYDNRVFAEDKPVDAAPEPNTRYNHLLKYYQAIRKEDIFYPSCPSYIRRKFEWHREMDEEDVAGLFSEFLSSPQLGKVAALIQKRLGRDLRPFDIWYDGFKSRASVDQSELDAVTMEKYPDTSAFNHNIRHILLQLGFSEDRASMIASRITVDSSRGAGHAWGATMKGGMTRLRTRVASDGMKYKGFNIAMHELGHNVEQVLSLEMVDHHMLHGVPGNGFTEAFAYVFQNRDLQVLGMGQSQGDGHEMKTLDMFWNTAELMAVSLVEMQVWNWLYDHPEATVETLKTVVIEAAQDIWNQYYAEHFGCRDEILLAVYSHMMSYPLYLADYPLGHLIHFQIEKYLEGKSLGEEMERMCAAGRIIPHVWMKNAVGGDISAAPFLDAVESALSHFSDAD
jgi:hypothetical protein